MKCIINKTIKYFFLLVIFFIPVTLLHPAYFVDDNGDDGNSGSFINPFRTIQKAADIMMTNNTHQTCYIFPGIYSEQVDIITNNNYYMIFSRLSNIEPILNGNGNTNYGFFVNSKQKVIIKGLRITRFKQAGIFFTNIMQSNIIIKNYIYDNGVSGIKINPIIAKNNFIVSNNIWGEFQDYGVHISESRSNYIYNNIIHNNSDAGINFEKNIRYTYIINNHIYSNNIKGIDFNSFSVTNNFIINNNIWGANQNCGLNVWGNYNIIKSNHIHNNQFYGIDSGWNYKNYITYNEIYSNYRCGVYLSWGGVNNYIEKNNIWGLNQENGIYLYHCNDNIINSNNIYKNKKCGIFFTNTSYQNHVVNNNIYSNENAGILFNSDDWARYNYILSNAIWGKNQNHGIVINKADNNFIQFNLVYKNQTNGVYLLDGACNNNILHNVIYGNRRGIYLFLDNTQINNVVANSIWSNSITGILLIARRNTITSNAVYRNQSDGIYIFGNTNYISKNSIYSNSDYGIQSYGSSITINSNTLFGREQGAGIRINDGDNYRIYRNLFSHSKNNNILIQGTATNIKIINNTIYGGLDSGIVFNNSSSGYLYNNIIISNGDNINEYGIQKNTSGSVLLKYNDFYGNISGPTNGGFIWGSGNKLSDPLTDTISTFTIISPLSPAVDAGTNIPGFTDDYNWNGPDMGWKESGFGPPKIPQWINAYVMSTNQIDLIWRNIKNETSYTLFRNTINSTNNCIKIAGLSSDITNYSDVGLSPWTDYYFWLKSYNIYGSSHFSDCITSKTFPCKPSRPKWIITNPLSSHQISLIWENIPVATSYTLFRSYENISTNLTRMKGFSIQQTSYTDSHLKADTIYYYWLKAYNITGASELSEATSAKTFKLFNPNLDNLLFGPNPWKGDGKFYFINLTENATIKVYAVSGKLVATLYENDGDGRLEWDVVNDYGKKLAGGVYIVHVSNSQNESKYLKIMLIP